MTQRGLYVVAAKEYDYDVLNAFNTETALAEKNFETYTFFQVENDVLSISTDLLPFKYICSSLSEPRFVDMDTDKFRAVLNYFRSPSKIPSPQLQYDLDRFKDGSAFAMESRIQFFVGYQTFYSIKSTLCKLPYFAAKYNANSNWNVGCANVDRDPVLFKQILTLLRHPLCTMERTQELQEEAIFWGVASPTKKDEEKDLSQIYPLKPCSTTDLLFNDCPDVTFFSQSHGVSPFVQHFVRFLGFSRSKKTIAGKIDSDGSLKFRWNFKQQVDAISKSFIHIETKLPVDSLEDLLEEINCKIYLQGIDGEMRQKDIFGSCHMVVNPLDMTHSARMMTSMAKMSDKRPIFEFVKVDWTNYITIPLWFFFCTSVTTPLFGMFADVMEISIKSKRLQDPSFKCHISSDVYMLSKEELEAINEMTQERLIAQEEQLAVELQPSKQGLISNSFTFERPSAIRTIYFLVYDASNGHLVNCILNGTFKIRDQVHPIDVFSNQRRQIDQFQGKKSYDSSLWFHTFSIHGATNDQPSGHLSVKENDTLDLDFTIESACSSVRLDVWISKYECFIQEKARKLFGNAQFPTEQENQQYMQRYMQRLPEFPPANDDIGRNDYNPDAYNNDDIRNNVTWERNNYDPNPYDRQ